MGQNVEKTITSEIVVAYSQCPRKAFLLLCTQEKGTPHEYIRILEQKRQANQNKYLNTLTQQNPNAQPYNSNNLKNGSDFLVNATLKTEGLEAECGLLAKVATRSALGKYSYEPTIFVGTYSLSKAEKLELSFVGHVLGQVQNKLPANGKIIGMDEKPHEVKLENSPKMLIPLLEPLQEWTMASSPEPPPVILNKHCPYCQFRSLCQAQAEQEDNLSLLDGITPKVIRQYEKKGIFTVKQLSYLFKPRKRKKRAKKPPPVTRKPELQALAIRTSKIYLQELPELTRQPVELFLDIEGIPDQQIYYLIGLLICGGDSCTFHSFWANTLQDEAQIWQQFLEKVGQYPDASIYHYGSYEPKAIDKLVRRYETDGENLKKRLVNVNTYIYGRVYFPVRSNRLKEIGKFIGATWTSLDASGLQTLVWRYRWDETQATPYQDLLMTYNREDCQALKLLADELSLIKHSADTLSEVDFANQPKQHATEIGAQLHNQFEVILKSAHADYDKNKIALRQKLNDEDENNRKRGAPKGHPRYTKIIPRVSKVIWSSPMVECPKHKDIHLQVTEEITERTIIDLVFTKYGVKKTVTRYAGAKSYCPKCYRSYDPQDFSKLGNQVFGHGFQSWVIYQRLFLRLPYRIITQVLKEQFKERISEGSIVNFLKYLASYYANTEQILIQHILASSFIHVDETKINIQGIEQYVWVLTDGNHVAFKLTATRVATLIHEILYNYRGILISDFYGGYDSVNCGQQKCWSHLIRDLNTDLWGAPFDSEFETFVLEVKNLIVPVLEVVDRYGLKKRHLIKFKKSVDQFYERVITGKNYKSELTLKYQKRFLRYQESLFVFIENDGIPWNNNMAERALRHLAVQRKISGTFFESVTHQYLLLLGIMQTCRFQDKSFLKFLLSGEKDIEQFERRKHKRTLKLMGESEVLTDTSGSSAEKTGKKAKS